MEEQDLKSMGIKSMGGHDSYDQRFSIIVLSSIRYGYGLAGEGGTGMYSGAFFSPRFSLCGLLASSMNRNVIKIKVQCISNAL